MKKEFFNDGLCPYKFKIVGNCVDRTRCNCTCKYFKSEYYESYGFCTYESETLSDAIKDAIAEMKDKLNYLL